MSYGLIDIAAEIDVKNLDNFSLRYDAVNDPPVTDTNTPVGGIFALEFFKVFTFG